MLPLKLYHPLVKVPLHAKINVLLEEPILMLDVLVKCASARINVLIAQICAT